MTRRATALALALTSCLGNPDSETMRDGIAFEALQHYMRNNQLTTDASGAQH
jgi:hypothetical protein